VNSDAAVALVLTTEADAQRAEALAQGLLEQGLVACVSLYPVTSHYIWNGRPERSQEVQLLIKTHAAKLEQVRQAVHELHSYTTPEWIHWPAAAGETYGAWVAASTGVISPGASPPDR
jgi:periplasmic divalent cation tolerance protein